jgi:hypothetical protein
MLSLCDYFFQKTYLILSPSMQASAYWKLDEIMVFGAILHLGNDAAASHAGTFFAGADLVKDVVDATGVDLVQFMDQLTTACKSVCRFYIYAKLTLFCDRAARFNQQGGLFKLPTLIDPIFTTPGARDRGKKIVGKYLLERVRK